MKRKKEEFDKYKELKYISIWILIVTSIAGFLWKVIGIEIQYVLFITIIIVLLIVIYLQATEIKHLKK